MATLFDPIFPVSDEYQILRDATAQEAEEFPRPATGRFVWVLPPKTLDGLAALQGERRFVAVRPFLALAWLRPDGGAVWHKTDGCLVRGGYKEATWLTDDWNLDIFPAGWTLPHLEAFFRHAAALA